MTHRPCLGFTIIELLVTMAVVAILAAVAVPVYQNYIVRAKSADILVQFDAARTRTGTALISAPKNGRCADVANALGSTSIPDNYARLAYAFEAVGSNVGPSYRPVLTVCASAARHGVLGVRVARAAYDELSKQGVAEPGPVLTDSVVSFSLRLSEASRAICTVPVGGAYTPCGDPVAVPPIQAMSVPTPLPMVAPPKMPMAVPKIQAYVMQFGGAGVYVRPSGPLDTRGPLNAFTLDMSFIGDGSIPASSGGQGPVMFNYGDGTNGHNALSLWNPHSLTVALLGHDYDTGRDVADGNTHRITTTWDSASGVLSVYDNGQLVKSWSGVSKGVPIPGGGSMVLAHKDNGGNSYNPSEAFAGRIFHASLANVAVDAAAASKPLNQVLDASRGMIVDVRAQGASVTDTTGRHTLQTGGVTAVVTGVDSSLVVPGSK
jgi:prepilin-type N-terminal cleavage/methylation domain-containing protein